MAGILGRKIGMTQIFAENGTQIPVTVVKADPNVVLQLKTVGTDGYEAVQLGFEDKREKLSTKPEQGHVAKANTAPKRFIREFRNLDVAGYELGQEVKVDTFTVGQLVDVTGTSKGKGFQGAIKRHGFSRGPMSHGSHYHRNPGSMGSIQANRVLKGKKLPGHMGAKTITVQNLEIVKIDLEHNVLMIKGNIPGSKKALIKVRSAVKAR